MSGVLASSRPAQAQNVGGWRDGDDRFMTASGSCMVSAKRPLNRRSHVESPRTRPRTGLLKGPTTGHNALIPAHGLPAAQPSQVCLDALAASRHRASGKLAQPRPLVK